MLRQIVVPFDGSPFSERALTVAVPLAQQHGASITLVQVSSLPPRVPPTREGETSVRSALQEQLERVGKRTAKKSGVTVVTQFRDGEILPELQAAVREVSADLIVMATHGRGGVSRMWLGSTADALLRELRVPLLLIRKARKYTAVLPNEPFFPRVLVALDGSPLSERALTEVVRLVGDDTAHLVLARVEDAPIAAVSQAWVDETQRQLTKDYLEPLAARYRTGDRKVTTQVLVHGDVARALLDTAASERAFLIAIATHGRRGARRLVLGSVADKIVRGTELPILVVPPLEGVPTA